MHKKLNLHELVKKTGGRYSTELGINLEKETSQEIFKWFLASMLFGARISTTIAMHTYQAFKKHKVLTPKKMIDTGWDGLVKILDEGGYVRYDYKTATKLLDVSHNLVDQYKGNLNNVHQRANSLIELEKLLKDLGKGVGAVTVNIFLRELRSVWPLAEPLPLENVINSAKKIHLVPNNYKNPQKILEQLKAQWIKDGGTNKSFPELEAALIRFAKLPQKHTNRN